MRIIIDVPERGRPETIVTYASCGEAMASFRIRMRGMIPNSGAE
jgi:hypothetical protein